ncbi:MAG: hypothetical protein ACLPVY_22750 [Acidimicrobiia bacterium]
MSIDVDRQRRADALIPEGLSDAQSVFKAATCLAYARGLTIQDAVDFGTEQARKKDSDFMPSYDVALLAFDAD